MIELRFPAPERRCPNLNDTDHWRTANTRKQLWQEAAFYAAMQAKVPTQGPSRLTVALPVTGRNRRDPHNFVLTVKYLVDGLVHARVLPDDSEEWLTTSDPVLVVGGTEVVITLEPVVLDGAR